MTDAVAWIVSQIAAGLGTYEFIVLGIMAVVLVCLICGSVGALVVGNRMAFFSDALAHCAFAGVGLGILVTLLVGGPQGDDAVDWVLPFVMILFGAAVGLAIGYVRIRTNLASDTVIGVFFAGAIGFGGILMPFLRRVTNKNIEQLLFGSINHVRERDILWLLGLGVLIAVFFGMRYNQLVFATFNPVLARSRRIQIELLNYVFIVLLAMIVNICLQGVGILLINAMLIVPAATAAILSRNLRQMFWLTIALTLFAGLGGAWISINVQFSYRGSAVEIGPGGWIIIICVLEFALAVAFGPRLKRRAAA